MLRARVADVESELVSLRKRVEKVEVKTEVFSVDEIHSIVHQVIEPLERSLQEQRACLNEVRDMLLTLVNKYAPDKKSNGASSNSH